ncbi:MAG: hypothetical protein OER88_12560 [Planctomycetota bacterium]|nr:hypothetical protein [Planctomycetota bacterium]
MPSDGIEVLVRAHEVFHSALAATVEQARGVVAVQSADDDAQAARLGSFAADRIDTARFASLLDRRTALDAATLRVMEDALGVLHDVVGQAAAPCAVQVEPGGSLHDTVSHAFAQAGRAFGATRVFELARSGRYRPEEHGAWLDAFPAGRWSRAERAVAPPLMVTVNGRDLRPEGLAAFLDGAAKILLVVRGDAPQAPLVRLIAPGVFVVQTDDPAALAAFGTWDGPGIAALLPGGTARFTHDPRGGDELWERVVIDGLPETKPPPFLGGRSAAQQRDELAQLAAYARRPAAPAPAPMPTSTATPAPVVAAAPVAGDPVDKLATWLLAQADLENIG